MTTFARLYNLNVRYDCTNTHLVSDIIFGTDLYVREQLQKSLESRITDI